MVALDEAIGSGAAGDADLLARCMIDRTWIVWSHDDIAPRFVDEMQRLQAPERPRGLLQSATAANKAGWEAWHCQDAPRAIAPARAGLNGGVLAREGFDCLPPLVFAAMGLTLADRQPRRSTQ